MHKMLSLADHMFDELKDGKSYAECAAKIRDTDRNLSECYSQMARERLDSFKRLKQQASRVYEEKARRAAEEGKDAKHLIEVHEWCMEKAAREESDLTKLIEASR